MKLNKSKCWIPHLGWSNYNTSINLEGSGWRAERDLVVLAPCESDVAGSQETKAHPGITKHCMTSWSKEVIVPLRSELVQPHLQHGWSSGPHHWKRMWRGLNAPWGGQQSCWKNWKVNSMKRGWGHVHFGEKETEEWPYCSLQLPVERRVCPERGFVWHKIYWNPFYRNSWSPRENICQWTGIR